MKEPMCNIPVSATIVVHKDGRAVVKEAEYREIPAALVAKYLIDAFGTADIFGESGCTVEKCESIWKEGIFGRAEEQKNAASGGNDTKSGTAAIIHKRLQPLL